MGTATPAPKKPPPSKVAPEIVGNAEGNKKQLAKDRAAAVAKAQGQ